MSKFCAMRCSCGLVCRSNQDCLLVDHGSGAYCVCDGLGDGQGGVVASHVVRAEIGRALATAETVEDRIRSVDLAVGRANGVIRTRAAREGWLSRGATAAVLVVSRGSGVEREAAVGWVGANRVYRFRDGILDCLTQDHTVGNGLFRRPPSLQVRRAQACLSALTRSVGSDESVRVEWRRFAARAGDVYLVCTDGVYGLLPEAKIASAFAEVASAESVADRLEAGVVAAGATDNYAFVVSRIG